MGALNLRAIIYHTGNSPNEGHYFACIKVDNIWYTCDDHRCTEGVKLYCGPSDQGDKIPYLLIYEKGNDNKLVIVDSISQQSDDTIVMRDDDSGDDVDFYFYDSNREKRKIQVIESTSYQSNESKFQKLSEQIDVSESKINDAKKEIKLKSYSVAAKTSVCRKYVICPDEDCH